MLLRMRPTATGTTMASPLFTLAEIESARPSVRSAVPPTPQYAWPRLKARIGADVFVKHENHTPIGAFKVRGGMVYMDRLRSERPQVVGIVSATRGNHGQSLAFAAGGARTVRALGGAACGLGGHE